MVVIKPRNEDFLNDMLDKSAAMHQLLSGKFDEQIKEYKKVKAEAEAKLKVVKTLEKAEEVLKKAEAEAAQLKKEVVEAAKVRDQALAELHDIVKESHKVLKDTEAEVAVQMAKANRDATNLFADAENQKKHLYKLIEEGQKIYAHLQHDIEVSKEKLAKTEAQIAQAKQKLVKDLGLG